MTRCKRSEICIGTNVGLIPINKRKHTANYEAGKAGYEVIKYTYKL